jgi:Predicted translation initiation factor 2B subunit, eIF-2B alpha/beta/delta family
MAPLWDWLLISTRRVHLPKPIIPKLHHITKDPGMFPRYLSGFAFTGVTRLTALELQVLNIPSVMICDTMVGSLFQHHQIDAVGKKFILPGALIV